jgi:hypothetical protein
LKREKSDIVKNVPEFSSRREMKMLTNLDI